MMLTIRAVYTTTWESGDTVIIDYWTGFSDEQKTMYPVEMVYRSEHWSRHSNMPINTGINTGSGIMVSGLPPVCNSRG